MKPSTQTISSFIFLVLSFVLLYVTKDHKNLNISGIPLWSDISGLLILPLISFILAIKSFRKSDSWIKLFNFLLITLSLLPILFFFLILFASHCGFYTEKCR